MNIPRITIPPHPPSWPLPINSLELLSSNNTSFHFKPVFVNTYNFMTVSVFSFCFHTKENTISYIHHLQEYLELYLTTPPTTH